MFAVGNGRFIVIFEETASSKWDVQNVGRKLFWVDKNSFIEKIIMNFNINVDCHFQRPMKWSKNVGFFFFLFTSLSVTFTQTEQKSKYQIPS